MPVPLYGLRQDLRPSAAALRRLPALAVVALAWGLLAAMLLPVGAVGPRLAWIVDLAAGGVLGPSALWAVVASLCRPGPDAAAWPHAAMWAAMATAMMLPCAVPGWRLLADDWRGGYGFLAGHLAVWLGFAAAAAALDAALASLPGAVDGTAAAVAAVAAWQWSGVKAAALVRLRHAGRPDAATGWRAGLFHGLRFGRACLLANGPLMALMLVAGAADLLAMAGVAAAMAVERLVPGRATPRLVGLVLFAVSVRLLLAG